MADHHVIVSTTGEFSTPSMLREFGSTLYQPADMNYARMMATNVDALFAHGWFGTAPKVGVVAVDSNDSRESVKVGLQPALARHGLSLADSYSLAPGTGGISQYSGAVLRFKADGVTHVFFSTLAAALLFMQNAQSQRYFPSYAIDSRQDPASLEANAPAQQLAHTAGIGWIPVEDLSGAHRTGITAPSEKRCLTAVAKSGQSTKADTPHLAAVWACDELFSLAEVLARATRMDLSGFRSAAESLGSAYLPASSYGSRFAPGRLHDGASVYRLNAYNAGCSCFRYLGPFTRSS
jgi:hypothetical protein